MSRRFRVIVGIAAALSAAAAPASAHAAPPKVDVQVVYPPTGEFDQKIGAKAAATTVRVGSRRCAVGAGTPLAALVRLVGRQAHVRDYGSCSKRPRDAAGLYVLSIGGDRAKGLNGWVYKVGQKLATAGAADPSGPFGRGRLRTGDRVTWFYCRMKRSTGSCQRTLGLKAEPLGDGRVRVTVRSYNDRGRSKPAAGVLAQSDDAGARTDENGVAMLTLKPGLAYVHAEAPGMVRSFVERVEVR